MDHPTENIESPEDTGPPTFVRHTKRDSWGVGVFLVDEDGKRAYQFEDGQLRQFKEGFFHLLAPEVSVDFKTRGRLIRLAKRAGYPLDGLASEAEQKTNGLRDQIVLFKRLYDGGFQGDAWKASARGVDAKRHLKRHRNEASRFAKAELAKDRIDALMEANGFVDVRDAISAVFDKSDVVPKSQRDAWAKLQINRTVTEAIRDFLHAGDDHVRRFDSLVAELRRAGMEKPAWQGLTMARALMRPEEHIYIRQNYVKEQMDRCSLSAPSITSPCGRTYEAYRSAMVEVKTALEKAELKPTDMLDVMDFVCTTLLKKNREKLDAIADEPASSDEAA